MEAQSASIEAVHVMHTKCRKFFSLFFFSHQEGQLCALNCSQLLCLPFWCHGLCGEWAIIRKL